MFEVLKCIMLKLISAKENVNEFILHNNKNTDGTINVLCFVFFFFWKWFQLPPLTWSVANSTSWLWWSRKRTSPGRQPSSWTITARFWGSEARSRSWVTTDSASITWSWTWKTKTSRACLLLLLCGFASVFHLWTTDSKYYGINKTSKQRKVVLCSLRLYSVLATVQVRNVSIRNLLCYKVHPDRSQRER